MESFAAGDSLMAVDAEDAPEPAVEEPPPKKAKAKAAGKIKQVPSKPSAKSTVEPPKPGVMVLDSEAEADKPAGATYGKPDHSSSIKPSRVRAYLA